MAKIDDFVSRVGALAQQMGIATLAIVVEDPDTGEQRVAAPDDAMKALRMIVAQKFNLTSEQFDTEWP